MVLVNHFPVREKYHALSERIWRSAGMLEMVLIVRVLVTLMVRPLEGITTELVNMVVIVPGGSSSGFDPVAAE